MPIHHRFSHSIISIVIILRDDIPFSSWARDSSFLRGCYNRDVDGLITSS